MVDTVLAKLMNKVSTSELETIAQACRSFVYRTNKHVGGSLSVTDFVVSLYFSGLARLSTEYQSAEIRDKVVYSKGHCWTPQVFCLWLHDYFPELALNELLEFGEISSPLPRMPQRDIVRGIEMSTGSLGQGLSFGNGLATADRKLGNDAHTYVILGDAECAEGQVWEAANTSVALGLRNVVAVIDANGFGSGITVPRDQWAPKWKAFGWKVLEVNGHDMNELCDALQVSRNSGPCAIVLNTIKGHGLRQTFAGTNTVGNKADVMAMPAYDIESDIDAAKRIVETHYSREHRYPSSHMGRTEKHRNQLEQLTRNIGEKLTTTAVGEVAHTKTFAAELTNLVGDDSDLMILSPDAIRNSGLKGILSAFGTWEWDNRGSPIIECPIAEQDAASLAAGLTAGGYRSIVFLMEGFVWRMIDSIRESICFPDIPVVLVATSGGLSDVLGPMVQSDTCFAAVSSLIGIECFEASDINEAKFLFAEALRIESPTYIRLPHEEMPVYSTLEDISLRDSAPGWWSIEEVKDPDLVLLTAGSLVPSVRRAASDLRELYGIRSRVLNVFSVTRFMRLSEAERAEIVPPTVPSISIHNAPPQVLGQFLGGPSTAMGLNSYGISGEPVSTLYELSGLGVEDIVQCAAALLGR